MFNILVTVIFAIGACYLLRWGYSTIVKRQRMDWPAERKLTKESIIKAYEINRRMTRWCWKYSAIFSPKNKS